MLSFWGLCDFKGFAFSPEFGMVLAVSEVND